MNFNEISPEIGDSPDNTGDSLTNLMVALPLPLQPRLMEMIYHFIHCVRMSALITRYVAKYSLRLIDVICILTVPKIEAAASQTFRFLGIETRIFISTIKIKR